MVTALLFTGGKHLIGLYLGHSATASSYGAAGSVIVLLLWVYYTSQLVMIGAEFTRLYAEERRGPVPASPFAEKTSDEAAIAGEISLGTTQRLSRLQDDSSTARRLQLSRPGSSSF